jgi:hypothetical protein
MTTKLKLSQEELVVLTAIADQELTRSEIEDTMEKLGFHDEAPRRFNLKGMIFKGLIVRGEGFFFRHAIAPEILALNKPPYSYESWKALSESNE